VEIADCSLSTDERNFRGIETTRVRYYGTYATDTMIFASSFLPRTLRTRTRTIFANGSVLGAVNAPAASTFSPQAAIDVMACNGSLTFTRGKRSRAGGELQQKQKIGKLVYIEELMEMRL
jgi:hypothetical protein